MKPKNFPARKYTRRCRAQGAEPDSIMLLAYRDTRTKKNRAGKGKLS